MYNLYGAATPPIQSSDSSKDDSNEQNHDVKQSPKRKKRPKRQLKPHKKPSIFAQCAQPISVRVQLDRGYLERLLKDQISSSSDKI